MIVAPMDILGAMLKRVKLAHAVKRCAYSRDEDVRDQTALTSHCAMHAFKGRDAHVWVCVY